MEEPGGNGLRKWGGGGGEYQLWEVRKTRRCPKKCRKQSNHIRAGERVKKSMNRVKRL